MDNVSNPVIQYIYITIDKPDYIQDLEFWI